jgi:glycosyltransferase involved in cell wall biosynthesis
MAISLPRADSDENVAAAEKPALLMTIYAHADLLTPTVHAAAILARDFRVRLVCRNTDAPLVAWHRGVELERAGSRATRSQQTSASPSRKVADFIQYVRALRRALWDSSANIIYSYDPLAFAGAMLAQRSGVHVVFHCHDTPPLENFSAFSFQDWLTRYSLRRTRDAALVVFPERNRAAYWLADAAVDDRNLLIVPNGTPRNFYPVPLDWQTLSAERFTERRVLYMSSMGLDNGHIEAVVAAIEAGFHLDFCGPCESDFRAKLEQMIRAADAEGRIFVKGWLDDPERKKLLERAAVGLVLYKPVSMNWKNSGSAVSKLFEYGAAGLPVVVPDRKSYREFLGNEKWIVFADVEDPRSIARAIEFLLSDRDRYVAMSRAAREAHEERFNYELLFSPVAERLRAMAGIGDRIAAA